MAGGLGVLFGKDPLNLSLEDQISFAAQVMIMIIVKSENDDDDGDSGDVSEEMVEFCCSTPGVMATGVRFYLTWTTMTQGEKLIQKALWNHKIHYRW